MTKKTNNLPTSVDAANSPLAYRDEFETVPFEMAQIPNVLFSTGWTNHQIIMSKCKTDSERRVVQRYRLS